MVDHLRLESERGGYEAAVMVADRLAALRSSAARLIGAGDGEVVITGSDTQAWTKALWGFALGGGIARGQRLLADRIAYDSHYLGLLQVCELTGATIEVVPSTGDGTIDLEALAAGPRAGARWRWPRSPTSGPTGAWSIRSKRPGRRAGGPGSRSSSMPARASASFRWTSSASAATWPPPPGANGCVGPGAPGSSSSGRRSPSGSARRASDGARPCGRTPATTASEPGADRLSEFEVPVAAHLGLGVAIDHALALGIEAIAERVDDLAERLAGRPSTRSTASRSTTAAPAGRAS